MTQKTQKVVTVRVRADEQAGEEWFAEVAVGRAIRLYGVRREQVLLGWRAVCAYGEFYRDLRTFLAELPLAQALELGSILQGAREGGRCFGHARDWLLDHGAPFNPEHLNETNLYPLPVHAWELRQFERVFVVGDQAEWGSYNLIYFGPIKGVTAKAVQVWEDDRRLQYRRLTLVQFANRNHDFDLARAEKANSEWTD